MAINVRPAAVHDLESLVDFNVAMADETEGRQLDRQRLTEGVRTLLSTPVDGRYLVAEADGAGVVGSLMLTFEWSDWRNGRFWWIQSVYVMPAWRRRRVYRSLHNAVRNDALNDTQACGLRLYVERDNRSAQAVYDAMGMVETDYLLFEEDFGQRQ